MGFKLLLKKVLFIDAHAPLSTLFLLKSWNVRIGKYIYKKKYTTEEIISKMRFLGLKAGSNVFIHSSWDSFYNYLGNEQELIDAILNVIGKKGTLAMPAYPLKRKNKIFDINKSVTAAGLLAETFRKYPQVKRSINERHSVCSLGPLSEILTCAHSESLICFDEKSPYYRMCDNDFLIFSLGLPPYFIGTVIHTVEAVLRNSVPYFSQFYTENSFEICCYRDESGDVKKYRFLSESGVAVRTDYIKVKYIVKRYFDNKKYGNVMLSNLNISFFDANYTRDRLIDLAMKGIVLYTTPRFK